MFEKVRRGLYRLNISQLEQDNMKPIEPVLLPLNAMNEQSQVFEQVVAETFEDEKLAPVPEPLLTKINCRTPPPSAY